MNDNLPPEPNLQPTTPTSPLPDITQPQEETPQNPPQKLWYIVGGIVILVLVTGLLFVLQSSKNTLTSTQQPTIQQKTIQRPIVSPTPILPRSKAPEIIVNAQTASAIDSQGKATSLSTTFAKTDKNIYLVLTLNKHEVGTKVEYIRYLNGKYLDNGTNKLLNAGITNTSFIWSLKKPGATHLVGSYKVKVYTNGIFEKETSYTVQ